MTPKRQKRPTTAEKIEHSRKTGEKRKETKWEKQRRERRERNENKR